MRLLTCHSIILKYIKNISNKLAINGNLNGLKFASILTSVTLLAANKQSFLGSLSDFGLPNNANVFGVFANCDWAVNVRFASNSKFYVYQIANVSHDAVFTLNFIVAYK